MSLEAFEKLKRLLVPSHALQRLHGPQLELATSPRVFSRQRNGFLEKGERRVVVAPPHDGDGVLVNHLLIFFRTNCERGERSDI